MADGLEARGRLEANGVVAFNGDGDFVRFYAGTKHMTFQSEQAGHAVYEKVDMVAVHHAGERDPIVRYVEPIDRARWPQQWEAYQAGQSQLPDGTSIAILFPADPQTVKNMEAIGIFTVEQLAAMADSAANNIPFGGRLKQKAIDFIAARDGAEGFNRVQAQLDRERERTKSLETEMAELKQQMATLSQRGPESAAAPALTPEMIAQIAMEVAAVQPPKRGPGRPPREE